MRKYIIFHFFQKKQTNEQKKTIPNPKSSKGFFDESISPLCHLSLSALDGVVFQINAVMRIDPSSPAF